MTFSKKIALSAAAAAAAVAATPAAAQVSGIATSNPTAVIVRSAARDTAYAQIEQTYAANIQSIRTLNTEMSQLEASLDTNQDGQLSQEEAQANPTVVAQIQQKQQQYETLVQPIALAQYYVIEQLIADYGNARQQVINDKGIQIMLDPSAIQWAPEAVSVTTDIVNALNTRMPTVAAAPPAGWQPQRNTVETHQAVQQILLVSAQAAYIRQQQAAQANGAAAPAQPVTQQPSGR